MSDTVTVSITDLQCMLAKMHPDWTVRMIGLKAREMFNLLKSDTRG